MKGLYYRRVGSLDDMTRLTAFLIAGSEDLTVTAYGPVDGKFGIYIGTMSETPSGSPRPRVLITSEPTYATAEAAEAAAQEIVAHAKEAVGREFPIRDTIA